MPQISPLIWPLIYLTTAHFLSMVILTLQEAPSQSVRIKTTNSISQGCSWNW